MRELTTAEISMVSGGHDDGLDQALVQGASAGFFSQLATGARLGTALGPKGAVGGALIAGAVWGVSTGYSYFRDS